MLWAIFVSGVAILLLAWHLDYRPPTESFITMGGNAPNIADFTTQALDSAPTTSEAKNHYKNLLLFADDDIRKQGVQGLRILADFRDRVYGRRDFRDDLTAEDFLANWPSWMPPLDTTIKEPVPEVAVAVTAESQLLAYLQKNFPQESLVDEQTGSTIRNLVEDFGYRFVFKRGSETVQLAPDFLRQPLLKNWTNPASRA
jgi:hypothetical protein